MTPKEFRKRILNNEKIPKNTTVEGYLSLIGCTSLTALPEGLCVKRYLDLEGCTSLTALPEGLRVEGNLNLIGCTSLKSLTGIESVGRTLYVDECFIESYPFEELPLLINLPFTEEIKDIIKKRFRYDSKRIGTHTL